MNLNINLPKKTLSLEEIDNISFDKYIYVLNENHHNEKHIIDKDLLRYNNALYDDIKCQIDSEIDQDKNIFVKNNNQVIKLLDNSIKINKTNKKLKKLKKLDKIDNLRKILTADRDNKEIIEFNKQNINNQFFMTDSKEEFVSHVIDFISDLIHENKFKNKF